MREGGSDRDRQTDRQTRAPTAAVITLDAPFTFIVVFAVNVDQDQASQNVQSDL